MASNKLKKYLAYYQKVLKDDPENIEARLRLAAIFRELGRVQHAVEEYVSASKLLAKEGLPLEAIAACKAVLELDPTHTEVQFFLARLFAQVPTAGGSRVATPVVERAGSSPRIEAARNVEPITLAQPKVDTTRPADVLADVWEPHEKPTRSSEVHLVKSEDTPPAKAGNTNEFRSQGRDSDLFETVDLDPADIIAAEYARAREDTALHPRSSTEAESYMNAHEPTEIIELGVFDMQSLLLDAEEFDFPDDFDEVDWDDLDEPTESTDTTSSDLTERAVLAVRRGDLPEIPLFSQLSVGTFMEVLQAMDLRKVSRGGPIIEQGCEHNSLFVIVRGVAQITRVVEGQLVDLGTLTEGEFFGEFRLLTGREGAATVAAKTDIELLEISEDVINVIAEHDPELWDVLWDFYYQRMLNNLLAGSALFRPLSVAQRAELASKFVMQEVLADDQFLREGQPCEHVYLILNGEVVVEREHAGAIQALASMREGEFFGVVSSFREDPYTADVKAVRDTTLLCLPSRDFRAVVDQNPEVANQVQILLRKRRSLDSAFMSGMTSYGEFGVTKH